MVRGFILWLVTGMVLALVLCRSALWLPAQATAIDTAIGHDGAVASVDERATRIGLDILREGGNAVDAAIATAAALGVTDPFSGGIGGGDFMLIYQKESDRILTLDGREQAPAATTIDLFRDPDSSVGEPLSFFPNRISSGAAVGVPGTPMMWVSALERYGTRSLADLLAPAIDLAESGFELDQTFVEQLQRNQSRFEAFTSTRSLFLANGLPQVGDRFRNPDLANTYRQLAVNGVNWLYRGRLGEAIVDTVQHPPVVDNPPFSAVAGQMTLADLDAYHLRVRPPVRTTYRGYEIYGMGLPSSGGITSLQVLNILSKLDLKEMDEPQAWHQVIEAERLAFADRNSYLGDPEFVDVPVAGLLDIDYATERRLSIGDRASEADRAEAGNPFMFQFDPSPSGAALTTAQVNAQEGTSTTHLVVSDRMGNVVSYTMTIESTGGSGIVVPGYGFLLNNELTDFDAAPHPNSPEPFKRPRSSMAPTIAIAPDGRVLAFGSPGGSTIITTVIGLMVNLMDFDRSMAEAIAFPRISQRNTGETAVDSQLDQRPLGIGLSRLGHTLTSLPEIGAATGLIVYPDGQVEAAAEPVRRGGGAAGVVSKSVSQSL
jgi:gamma-glutamyltranspeptidase / glutathione hydrolase